MLPGMDRFADIFREYRKNGRLFNDTQQHITFSSGAAGRILLWCAESGNVDIWSLESTEVQHMFCQKTHVVSTLLTNLLYFFSESSKKKRFSKIFGALKLRHFLFFLSIYCIIHRTIWKPKKSGCLKKKKKKRKKSNFSHGSGYF